MDDAEHDETTQGCPMPCTTCTGPVGPSVRSRRRALEQARAGLDLAARLGLVVRRFRRAHALSQRALADRLGWHCSTLSRAELDASALTLHRAQQLLSHVGYRLAIVPDRRAPCQELGEDADTAWDAVDLLARDAAGRRLPPFGVATWTDEIDRRLRGPARTPDAGWTWQRRSA